MSKIILKEFESDIIADLAVKALLHEVSISPKAGLVTKYSGGSHRDMDFHTFEKSAYALRGYFKQCFEYSPEINLNDKEYFLGLRNLGIEAEKKMFESTDGVNTHKGTIFSMGILISVFSNCLKTKKINFEEINERIKKMSKPLEKELENSLEDTNGEKIYKKYGIKGARGLALSGYSVVLLDGIEKLYNFLEFLDLETSCILLLFYYMSILDDTNIISRSDIETLKEIKRISKEIYLKNEKRLNEKNIKKDMEELNEKFVKKNISPGGSADLLILTIFLYFLSR